MIEPPVRPSDVTWPESCWVKNRELQAEMNRFVNQAMEAMPINYGKLFSVSHIEPSTRWQRIKRWPRRQWWDLKDWIRHWVEDWE
jgi:hypothetical protein